MDVTYKICRYCNKKFTVKRKQARYCDDICAYSGRKQGAFRQKWKEYVGEKPVKLSYDDYDIYRDSGLSFGKQGYSE